MARRPMIRMETRRMLAGIASIAALVVILDLLANRVVTDRLGPDAERHAWWLIGDEVGLEYVRNTGAAFGMFGGNPELLAAVSVLVSLGLVWLVLSEMPSVTWATISAGLLVGGAMGNLIGRIADGFVTDYIAVGPWPRFNIADSAITVGVAIFVISLVFGPQPEPGESSDNPASGREAQHDR